MNAKKHVFIVLSLILLAPILLLFFELMSRNIENVYTRKYKFFAEQSTEIKTLIIGSSHPLYGVDPDYFTEKAFNISLVSQSFVYDYELLKYALPKLPNLKRVLISISTFSMHVEVGKDTDKGPHARKYFYKHYTPIGIPMRYFDKEKNNYSTFKYYFIFGTVQLKGLFNYYFGLEKSPPITDGGFLFDKEIATAEKLVSSAKVSSKRHRIQEIGKNISVLPYFIKILDLLKKHNIEVILYAMPAHEEYIKLRGLKVFEEYFQFVAEIAASRNIPFYNYFFGKEFGFEEKHYRDSDHLNIDGAEKFSKLLNSQL